MTLTRTAFRASLGIANAPRNVALQNLKVTLNFKVRGTGQDRTTAFAIPNPTVTGISDVAGAGTLAPGGSAQAVWKILPTRDAAPTADTEYLVGGKIEYDQGGTHIVVDIFPALITVRPEPLLKLKYFLQKDVYSDDPFTEIVEKAEPFPLGLLVVNQGYGTARNMTIQSSQPQIVENEKGLLVGFKILGANVNDDPFTPSLLVNLGDVGPTGSASGTVAATWFMTCSLQGRFIDFVASYKHLDGLGNNRASLIDGEIETFLLDHVVRLFPDDKKPDFLTDQTPDEDKAPDTVHSSTGAVYPVTPLLNATMSGQVSNGNFTVTLRVPTTVSGYAYIRATDPSAGRFKLVAVRRADGDPVKVGENAWLTSRTVRPLGRPAERQHRLHLFDRNPTSAYILTYGLPDPLFGSPGDVKGGGDGLPVNIGDPDPDDPGNGGGGGGGDDPGTPGNPGGGAGSNLGLSETGVTIVGVYPDALYVEAIDRSSGIKLVPPAGFIGGQIGDRVVGKGVLKTDTDGERYIEASELTVNTVGALEPLGISIRSLYGGDFFYDPSTGGGQIGFTNGAGLNPIGLLIRTFGIVTAVNGTRFSIDDGTGRPVQVVGAIPGSLPAIGTAVQVTGVVSMDRVGDVRVPVLLVRSLSDIVTVPASAALSLAAPPGTLRVGQNLFSLPGVPSPADPASVMGFLPPAGGGINGRFFRYDALTQSEVVYEAANPVPFGSLLVNDSFRFRLDPIEAAAAGGLRFSGYPVDFADYWVSLPVLGATRIGMPFTFPVPWETVYVSDGIRVLPLREAAKGQVPGWLSSVAEGYNNATGLPTTLGLPEDNPTTTQVHPWAGYFVFSQRNKIALHLPTRIVAPTLTALHPERTLPGGPSFLLTVTGANFRTRSVVHWNGQERPTTYVSENVLIATIPASDIASAGVVPVQVVTPDTEGNPLKSGPLNFIIGGNAILSVEAVTDLLRNGGTITATVRIKNTGTGPANDVAVTASTLNNVATTTNPLPTVPTIPAGESRTVTLTYPATAGNAGQSVFLRVTGQHSGGTFTASRRVTLP